MFKHVRIKNSINTHINFLKTSFDDLKFINSLKMNCFKNCKTQNKSQKEPSFVSYVKLFNETTRRYEDTAKIIFDEKKTESATSSSDERSKNVDVQFK